MTASMHPYILSIAVDYDEQQHEKISFVLPVFYCQSKSRIKGVNMRRGREDTEGMKQPLQHPSDTKVTKLIVHFLQVVVGSWVIQTMLIVRTLLGTDQSQSLMQEEDP